MSATSKEDAALRVGYDILHIGRIEILENRNYYSAICYCSDIRHTPINVISADKSNLLTLLDTYLLKKDMQASHTLSHLKICQCLLTEVIC